jgi:hypothetical protein
VGTGATIDVGLQFVGAAVVPLKLTVLVPCVEPKLLPVIVTELPTGPAVGERLVIEGAVDATVKVTPLLAIPPTVTTTFPVVAPAGTSAATDVELQLLIDVAAVPLKLTVLVACVEPKLEPLIVTEVATGPEVGETLAIEGGALLRPAKVMSLRAGIWPATLLVSTAWYCKYRDVPVMADPELPIGVNALQVLSGSGVLPPRTLIPRLVPAGVLLVHDAAPQFTVVVASKIRERNVPDAA